KSRCSRARFRGAPLPRAIESRGAPHPRRTETGLARAGAGTAVGQLAVDDDCGDASDAEVLGALCDRGILHVEDAHLARRAGDVVDDLNGVVTRVAAST